MKKICLLFCLIIFFSCTHLFAQTPIDVAESTLKISPQGEETFYYGFAEGD